MQITVDSLNVTVSAPDLQERMDQILSVLIDLQTAQAAEKADLGALVTAFAALLTAIANGTLSATQAQSIVTEMNSEDSSIKSLTAQINAQLAGGAPPTITSLSPATGAEGASVALTITGTGFAAGQAVVPSSTGVTVSNVVVVSPTQITCTLAIGATVPVGNITIAVGSSNAVNFSVTAAGP